MNFFRRPKVSVIVAFYNMRREAQRTLFAFTTAFQRDVDEGDYEVIVLDSNSSEPLDKHWVESLQENFRYFFVESDHPTPNRAMNFGISQSRAPLVTCLIDGARIPSPGMLRQSLNAQKHFGPAYVMSLGMHLGPDLQQISVSKGYCQHVEDDMLANARWEDDGYRLFEFAVPARSSGGGFFLPIAESNCFTVPKRSLQQIGGFDERFVERGGGLINLHVHNQLIVHPELLPVMLLGEASFHQFHGGVSTNVPQCESPFDRYCKEYQAIVGRPFAKLWRDPLYLGSMPLAARRYLCIEE